MSKGERKVIDMTADTIEQRFQEMRATLNDIIAGNAAMDAYIRAIEKAAAPFIAMADEADAGEWRGETGYLIKASDFQLYAECAALRAAIAGYADG